MTIGPDDMRSLIISAHDGGDIVALLTRIPGYELKRFEDTSGRRIPNVPGERRFNLCEASDGEVVVVRVRDGESRAETINVIGADAGSPVPLHEDALVRLHRAIAEVEGLGSQVVAAERDLRVPPG